MDIPLPQSNQPDIYSYGFDQTLNVPTVDNSTPTVYDSMDPTTAQNIAFGSLTSGSDNNTFAADPGQGIWLGNAQFENAPFSVTQQGVLKATAANITGTITASSGTIGGWTINSSNLQSTNATLDAGNQKLTLGSGNNIAILDASDATYRMAIGNATYASAPFRVDKAGNATATSITITGGSISSTPISSIPNNSSTDISLLEKTWTMTFSVTDADTVAWTSGTITMSNGRTFTISSGNTGNMAALTYIYLDPSVSSTVLQTTTTASTALGANKCLIGTAQNNTVTASFIPYGPGQPLVDGSNIGASSITANNIAASTITAAKMNVTQLSAIAADLGSITAGTVNLTGAGSNIHSGQSAYNTGAGWWLEYNSGTPRFSIGDGTTSNSLTWDGSSLKIGGYVVSGKGAFGGDGSDGALSISSGTTTINCGGVANVIKNYTSISITGTGKLAFSNPHPNGTIVTLKSQGAITLTSSSAPMVDMSGMGATGGTAVSASDSASHTGTTGTQGLSFLYKTNGGVGSDGGTGTGGAGGAVAIANIAVATSILRFPYVFVGAGGASGGISSTAGSTSTSGAGGNGGGGLIIECAGAFNFTTANGISVAGATGGNGSHSGANYHAGGGGGGGGGFCIILYNTLTANSGTITVSGGVGGNSNASSTSVNGGGGGGSLVNTGSAGSNAGDGGQSGGNGGDGASLVILNNYFA